jgi:hypothetical protein
MAGIVKDEQDPQKFHVDWSAVHAGLNPWKRTAKVSVDPFLVAKAVKGVMRQCTHQTAAARPLVWNEYTVFLELSDWEHVKKLESTLVRDLGGIVEKEISRLKAEMVGAFNVRLLRDEGGSVRPGTAVIKVDFSEVESPEAAADPREMTVRFSVPLGRTVLDMQTQNVPELGGAEGEGPEELRVTWAEGETTIRGGARAVLGRPHTGETPGFVPLTGASTKINKRQVWIEAEGGGAVIGRLSDANPVEVNGRLLQAGGQIDVDTLPAEISLSSGELVLTVDRLSRVPHLEAEAEAEA